MAAGTKTGWERVLDAADRIIETSSGPRFVSIVCGSESDRRFWEERATKLAADLFCADGRVRVHSVVENVPKGNFLGTVDAWATVGEQWDTNQNGLMTMVFGEGRRLSPFTQALGNRKPALPTPAASHVPGIYLNAAELAMRQTVVPIEAMNRGGFRGLLVKWGDEAVVSDHLWPENDLHDVDAIRFVSMAEPNEITAREKEWLVIKPATGEVVAELPRQDPATLAERIEEARAAGLDVGVNLGSLAASYRLLDAASEVLPAAIPEKTRLDWDPFVWMALLCRTDRQWSEQIERTRSEALRRLLASLPDFYPIVRQWRDRFEAEAKRPLRVLALDFGQPLWVDFGLHTSARRALLSLVQGSQTAVARRLFRIPDRVDEHGNVVIRSVIAPSARVTNSVVIDSSIGDGVVDRGVIVNSAIRALDMRHPGVILFSRADRVQVEGGNAIAFAWQGRTLKLGEGDRVSMVRANGGSVELRSNESLVQSSDETFNRPVFGNPISFAEAAALAAECGAAYRDNAM